MMTLAHWIALIVTVIYVVDAAMDMVGSLNDWLYTRVTGEKGGRLYRVPIDALWLAMTIITFSGVASVPY